MATSINDMSHEELKHFVESRYDTNKIFKNKDWYNKNKDWHKSYYQKNKNLIKARNRYYYYKKNNNIEVFKNKFNQEYSLLEERGYFSEVVV